MNFVYFNVTLYTSLLIGLKNFHNSHEIFLTYNTTKSNGVYPKPIIELWQNLAYNNSIYSNLQTPTALMKQLEDSFNNGRSNQLYVLLNVDNYFLEYLKNIFNNNPNALNTKWVILTHTFNKPYNEYFQDMFIKITSIVEIIDTDHEIINIWEVYKLSRHGPLRISVPFIWNITSEKFIMFKSVNLVLRRSNLHAVTLRVATFVSAPFLFYNKNSDVAGYFGSIWRELEKECNFTSQYVFYYGENKQIHGYQDLNHAVQDGSAEVGLQAQTMTPEQFGKIDFSEPLITIPNVFIFRQSTDEIAWNTYLVPFTYGVWTSVLILIISTPFILNFLHSLNCRFRYLCVRNIFSETLLDIFGAYCQQGTNAPPQEISFRIVYLTVYMSSVILLSAYSASLISTITVQKFRPPFLTFEQLLEDGTYTVGVLRQSFQFQLFNESDLKIYKVIGEKHLEEEHKLPENHLEGIKRVCERNKYTYFVDQITYEYFKLQAPCIINAVETKVSSSLSFIFQKYFPFRQLLRTSIIKFMTNGILNRILYKELQLKFKKNTELPFRTVDLRTILPLVSLLVLSFIFCLLYLQWEKHKWALNKEKKQTIFEKISDKYCKIFWNPICNGFKKLIPKKIKEVLEIYD